MPRRHTHRHFRDIEDLSSRHFKTSCELHETITYLIQQRERLRDEQLAKLSEEAKRLLKRAEAKEIDAMLEEIACFKDVLALHRKLIEDDQPGD